MGKRHRRMEKRYKIGVVCFDLQNFTSDFLNRLHEEVKEYATVKAFPILDKIGDLQIKFDYELGEDVKKHKVKTYAKNDKHTPEGMLITPNYKNAIKCSIESDIIMHYGIQSSTSLISGFLGFVLRRKQISINQTLPLVWEKKRKWWILYSKIVFFKFCKYHVAQTKVSLQSLDIIYKIKKDKIFYIPFESGINSFKIKFDKHEVLHTNQLKNESPITFLFASNLLRFKGVYLIIDALEKLIKKDIDVKLVIAGPESISNSEPRINDLIQYTKLKGIQDKVNVIGNMSHDELVIQYINSDVFVLPTMKDTFGKVLVEAGVAGKPLITSDACGSVDTIVFNDLNGYVFKAGSVEDLAICMEKIANRDVINKMATETKKIIEKYLIETQNEAELFKNVIFQIIK